MFDITEAKRLADAADRALEGVTDGPWAYEHDREGSGMGWIVGSCWCITKITGDSAEAETNAEFIAYTRSGVPALAASLRDAVEEIERLREFVKRVELFSNDGFLARDARALIDQQEGKP